MSGQCLPLEKEQWLGEAAWELLGLETRCVQLLKIHWLYIRSFTFVLHKTRFTREKTVAVNNESGTFQELGTRFEGTCSQGTWILILPWS